MVGGGITYRKPGDQPLRLRGVVEAAAQVEERAPPGNSTNKHLKRPLIYFQIRFQYQTPDTISIYFNSFHMKVGTLLTLLEDPNCATSS